VPRNEAGQEHRKQILREQKHKKKGKKNEKKNNKESDYK